jgi:choline dehydrogenase-like flavoprotein
MRDMADFDYDVVGSGFGGSVAALHLSEKGYRVGVLDAGGRRFEDADFAKTSWRRRQYLFAPAAGCYGTLRMTLLKNTFVLSGIGVGGRSLVYANTLGRPLPAFFKTVHLNVAGHAGRCTGTTSIRLEQHGGGSSDAPPPEVTFNGANGSMVPLRL